MRNGYFRLVAIEQEYGLQLIPPVDGGENIKIAEVVDYLERNKLVYDLSVLREKVLEGEQITVPLAKGTCPSLPEDYVINISEDKMSATVRVSAKLKPRPLPKAIFITASAIPPIPGV